MWALVESNSISKIYGRPTALQLGDIQYPQNIFSLWSEAELKATKKSEINPECPALANPSYVPYQ